MKDLPYYDDVQEYIAREPEQRKALKEHLAGTRYKPLTSAEQIASRTKAQEAGERLSDMRENNRSKKARSRGKLSRARSW